MFLIYMFRSEDIYFISGTSRAVADMVELIAILKNVVTVAMQTVVEDH